MSVSKSNGKNSFRELLKTLMVAGSIAIVFRSIFFEPFNIPSGSMIPTLLVGDYLFVSKYSYGYSKYSFPFGIAPIEERIFDNSPKRGDVIVFRKPGDESIDYIKRLVALPNDTVQVKKGILFDGNTSETMCQYPNTYFYICINFIVNISPFKTCKGI